MGNVFALWWLFDKLIGPLLILGLGWLIAERTLEGKGLAMRFDDEVTFRERWGAVIVALLAVVVVGSLVLGAGRSLLETVTAGIR